MKNVFYILFSLFFLTVSDASAQDTTLSEGIPSWMEYQNLYAQSDNDIGVAHRTNGEVTAWSMRAVANVLSFTEIDFKSELNENKNLFQQSGWVGYASYLKSANVLKVLQAKKYSVSTVSNGDPSVLRSGKTGDAWSWMVRVPLMTSVLQKDPAGVQHAISTSTSDIVIIVSRVATGGGEEGILIVDWSDDTD